MQPQSAMRPAPAQGAAQPVGAFSLEEITQISQETGYPVPQVVSDIQRTGAQTKEQLYANFYSGSGIEPQGPPPGAGVAQGGAPPPAPMAAPPEEAAAPPRSVPQEAAEGEGLSPEGVAAMQMAMKREKGPMMPSRREPPMRPRR